MSNRHKQTTQKEIFFVLKSDTNIAIDSQQKVNLPANHLEASAKDLEVYRSIAANYFKNSENSH